MLEKIAMWGGIAAIVVAIFAIVILYLTRSNIIDLLDRDVVMYDKNYELKKESLQEAFNCLDLVAQNGLQIKSNPQFITRAKEAYNGLLCTLNSAKLYQEFYKMALDTSIGNYSVTDIEKFKIACRGELISKKRLNGDGFKGMPIGALDGVANQQLNTIIPKTQPQPPVQRPQARPAQPRPSQAPQTGNKSPLDE